MDVILVVEEAQYAELWRVTGKPSVSERSNFVQDGKAGIQDDATKEEVIDESNDGVSSGCGQCLIRLKREKTLLMETIRPCHLAFCRQPQLIVGM